MTEHKCYLQEDDPPEQHDLSHYSCVCGACYSALADLERAAQAQRDAALAERDKLAKELDATAAIDGSTVNELLAERDKLAAQVAVLREALVEWVTLHREWDREHRELQYQDEMCDKRDELELKLERLADDPSTAASALLAERDQLRAEVERLRKDRANDFRCPKCGGPYFGRDVTTGPDGKPLVLDTVRCHGASSLPRVCDWRGEWPVKDNAPATPRTEEP